MTFRLLAFGPHCQEGPSGHVKGKLSNAKKTDADEYCLKCCILKETAKDKATVSCAPPGPQNGHETSIEYCPS